MRNSRLAVDASLRQVLKAKLTVAKELEKTPLENVLTLVHRRADHVAGKRKLNYVIYPSGAGGFANPTAEGIAVARCVAEAPVEYKTGNRRRTASLKSRTPSRPSL